MILSGWIDEVSNGVVYGRFDDEQTAFEIDVLDVLESQRVDLEPGRYVYFVNGHMMMNNAFITTHDIDQAKERAKRLIARFNPR